MLRTFCFSARSRLANVIFRSFCVLWRRKSAISSSGLVSADRRHWRSLSRRKLGARSFLWPSAPKPPHRGLKRCALRAARPGRRVLPNLSPKRFSSRGRRLKEGRPDVARRHVEFQVVLLSVGLAAVPPVQKKRCVYIYIYTHIYVYIYIYTSSTAQGGGGSFKNSKSIGEVGCCESRMAGRIHWWTERWLELCFLEWLQWLQWSPHHNCWM